MCTGAVYTLLALREKWLTEKQQRILPLRSNVSILDVISDSGNPKIRFRISVPRQPLLNRDWFGNLIEIDIFIYDLGLFCRETRKRPWSENDPGSENRKRPWFLYKYKYENRKWSWFSYGQESAPGSKKENDPG